MTLELRNIYKSFGEKKVLKGISLSAESGSAFGLLGRNGAGKTTSIRILMDVFPADMGSVLINGKPIDYKKIGIGYLPEERGLYPKKNIGEQLIYFARLKGMSSAAASKSVDYWLDRLDMLQYKGKRLDTLSKGNQQKIQLVTALAHDPDIIILDEPFSGLDPVNAMLLKDVVNEEIGRGKIVLFSSHQMNYIEEFCQSIAILKDGNVAISGNLYDIKRSYPRDKLIIRSEAAKEIAANEENCRLTASHEVMLRLPSPDKKCETMAAIAEKYDVDEIKIFEPTLNDIFVEYAGDSDEKKEGN